MALEDRLDDGVDDVQDRPHNEENEKDAEYHAAGGEGVDLSRADRRKGDSRHEQGIQERPSLDQRIAGRPEGQQRGEDQHTYRYPAQVRVVPYPVDHHRSRRRSEMPLPMDLLLQSGSPSDEGPLSVYRYTAGHTATDRYRRGASCYNGRVASCFHIPHACIAMDVIGFGAINLDEMYSVRSLAALPGLAVAPGSEALADDDTYARLTEWLEA